jgi:endonuclease YncB( thermonuclease family)
MAFGMTVRVEAVNVGRYGRVVGQLYAGTDSINAALVAQCAAWCYRKYMKHN